MPYANASQPTRRSALQILLTGLATAPTSLIAQGFPNAPVRIVMPFGPGGADVLYRVIAERLQDMWGQPVIIDYKPGAATVVGTDYVTKSRPDGLTMGMAGANLAVNPIFYKSIPYKRDSWRAVANLVDVQMALVTRPDAPFNNIDELIVHGKANPGKLTYGIAGLGATYMGIESLKRRAKFDMLKIGFNSNGAAQTELLGGRLDVLVDPLVGLAQHIKSGKMKVLAMLGRTRYEGWEGYPAANESLPGFSISPYYGIIVPHSTPEAVVRKAEADVASVLREPHTQKRIAALGLVPNFQSGHDFEARSDADVRSFAELARTLSIVLE